MQKDKILKDVTEDYKTTHVFPENIRILSDQNNGNQFYLQITTKYRETIEKIIEHIPYVYEKREDGKYCFTCYWYESEVCIYGNASHSCWRDKDDK